MWAWWMATHLALHRMPNEQCVHPALWRPTVRTRHGVDHMQALHCIAKQSMPLDTYTLKSCNTHTHSMLPAVQAASTDLRGKRLHAQDLAAMSSGRVWG